MSTNASYSFVFVGGVPRSGTSLVQKILDLHSQVYGGPEMGILGNLMSIYDHLARNIESGKLSMVVKQELARRCCQEFLASLYAPRVDSAGETMISEKTPGNILVFDALAEVFPAARFIWVVRDPRDVVCSLRAVQDRGRERGVAVEGGRWLHEDLRMMRQHLEAGEAFRRSHPDRLHLVHYEDLLSAPEAAVREMCRFLDVPFEERMLETQRENDTSEAIASKRKTNGVFYTNAMFDRPIDATNVGKWKGQLDSWTLSAIRTALDPDDLPCLSRYDLEPPGWGWPVVFSVADPLASLTRAAVARIRS